GGSPKWKAEGRTLEAGPPKRPPRTFSARKDADLVASLAAVRAALASGSAQLVDARPAERFLGQAPEPRPGLRSGHMPGALNVPSTSVIENGRLAPPEKLRRAVAPRRRRPRGADHHQLRLRGDGRDPLARARRAQQSAQGALRRFMVGMGIARRSADRTESLNPRPRMDHGQREIFRDGFWVGYRTSGGRRPRYHSCQFRVGGVAPGAAHESPRHQYGRRRRAVQPHVRAGIGNANEQPRRRSERPRARPKRAVCPPPLPVPIGAWRLLRLWSSIAPLEPEIRG